MKRQSPGPSGGGGGSYTLPTATDTVLGGIKVGSGLTITDGVLAATGGGGGGSAEDAVLRALFVPPAPTSVTATAGNAQAAVSWTAPTGVIAQAPVTDYVVQYSSNSGSSWTTFADGTSTATSAVVTSLTNGTAYTFRVAATNAIGTGSYSTASDSATPGTASDPSFSSVSLLLHMDGSSAGTTFTDNSGTPKTVTAAGNAVTSTARSKFGTASALFDGTGDYLSTPSNAAFAFGTGDFTVECWVYRTSAPSLASVMGVGYTTGGFGLAIDSSNNVCVTRPGTAIDHTFAGAVPMNAWSHIAITRSGTSLRCYVDGVQKGSTASNSTNYAQGELVIGMDGDKTNQGFVGNIDEFRITKGVARYTGATLTVPTAAFPDASGGGGGSSYTPTAVLLTSGTSYTVPSGATSMKAWAVGGGGGTNSRGGAGGTSFKTWSVSGGSSVAFAVGDAGVTGASPTSGGNSTVTYGGTTITGNGGASSGTGGGYSGGDGGANGGDGTLTAYPYRIGGAVGGNGQSILICAGYGEAGRRPATDVSGLLAAVTLAGGAATQACGSTAAFGSSAHGGEKNAAAQSAGLGGGAAIDMGTGQAGGGAVVLYFT